MLPQRATAYLPSVGKQSVRAQWLQSGKCARCFHATRSRRADGDETNGAEASLPYNQSAKGPSRKERAAKISDEISAIAKGSSADGVAPKSSDSQNNPSTQEGRMGENSTADREGPLVQGSGVASLPSSTSTTQNMEPVSTGGTQATTPIEKPLAAGKPIQITRSKSSRKPSLDRDALVKSGQGASTIAGSNFEGVLMDRMHLVARPGTSTKHYLRDSTRLKSRLNKSRLIGFQNRAELESLAVGRRFKPVQKSVRQALVDKLVLGKHDGEDLLAGQEKYKQNTLNVVARATTLNSTYLAKDAGRLLNKVRSLLPATSNAQQAQAGNKAARK